MWIVNSAVLSLEGLLALVTGYQLALLGAAASRRWANLPSSPTGKRLRFAVLIPARDEERVIGDTLASLRQLDYPAGQYEVIVIADNCHDQTASLAAAAGATVWERQDPGRPGKGQALAWALKRLGAERPEVEAVAFMDADCRPSSNLLTAMDERLSAGAAAVQVTDAVANPGESWPSALRYASFVLLALVRPLGKEALGLSCGLFGTGMGFRRAFLERHPWSAFSVAEDSEYHARLVAAGERVAFAAEASVSSEMPTSLRQSRAQHQRYESGKWEMIRIWAPRLIVAGLRRRDPIRLHAGLEALVPPQSLLLAANALLALLAVTLQAPAAIALALINLAGQVWYIVGGLMLVRAPAVVYRALAMTPVLVVWKLWLHLGLAVGRGPKHWVRAPR